MRLYRDLTDPVIAAILRAYLLPDLNSGLTRLGRPRYEGQGWIELRNELLEERMDELDALGRLPAEPRRER